MGRFNAACGRFGEGCGGMRLLGDEMYGRRPSSFDLCIACAEKAACNPRMFAGKPKESKGDAASSGSYFISV